MSHIDDLNRSIQEKINTIADPEKREAYQFIIDRVSHLEKSLSESEAELAETKRLMYNQELYDGLREMLEDPNFTDTDKVVALKMMLRKK